jgi:hypothetical protein
VVIAAAPPELPEVPAVPDEPELPPDELVEQAMAHPSALATMTKEIRTRFMMTPREGTKLVYGSCN